MKKILIIGVILCLIFSSTIYVYADVENLKYYKSLELESLIEEIYDLEDFIRNEETIDSREIFLLIEELEDLIKDFSENEDEDTAESLEALETLRNTARYKVKDSYKLKKYNISKAPDVITALPTSQKVTVDGDEVKFRAYNINGSNFFMLRDIAYIFKDTSAQFEVGWDGEKKAISLITEAPYSGEGVGFAITGPHVKEFGLKSNADIYKDGELEAILGYNIKGNTYFKLRDLGEELNIGVKWDPENKVVVLKSDGIEEENTKSSKLELVEPVKKENLVLPKEYKTQEDFEKLFIYMGYNNEIERTLKFKINSQEEADYYMKIIKPAFRRIFRMYPEYYSFGPSLNYGVDSNANLFFKNHNSKFLNDEDIIRFRKIFTEEVDKILNQFIEDGYLTSDMTQLEQAKFLYDWILDNTEYDYTYSKLSYTGYGQIKTGKAVCQGYAATYNYMLKRLGIETYGIVGDAGDENSKELHMWTIAYLDGKRYHIDTTWGDGHRDEQNIKDQRYFATNGDALSRTHTWDRTMFGD